MHEALCDAVEPVPTVVPPPAPLPAGCWEDRPAVAPSRLEKVEALAAAASRSHVEPHVPCPTCGRRFTAERLPRHRRACAGHALPGFRAMVSALDACDHEYALVQQARAAGEAAVAEANQRAATESARAETAEARAVAAAAALEEAKAKADRSEAAAKSMEAAYDVVAEALEDGKLREVALRKRLDDAEAALDSANARAERADAAAKSMEAAYDVVAEALEDSKKRESALQQRAEEAEALLKTGRLDDQEIAFLPQ